MPRNRNDLVYYGVLGFIAYTGYGLALDNKLGNSMYKLAKDLQGAWKNTPANIATNGQNQGQPGGGQQQTPAATPKTQQAPAAPQSGYVVLAGAYDIGDPNQPQPSFPIVYDTALGTVRQDPRQGGTNIYRPGDVFFVNGALVTYLGGTKFSDNGSGRTLTI